MHAVKTVKRARLMSSSHYRFIGSRRCCSRKLCLVYGIALCLFVGHIVILQYSVMLDDSSVLVASEADIASTNGLHRVDYHSPINNITSTVELSVELVMTTRKRLSPVTSSYKTTDPDDLVFDDDISSPSNDHHSSTSVRRSSAGVRVGRDDGVLVSPRQTSTLRDQATDLTSRQTDNHRHQHYYHPSSYQFNCSNIARITLKHQLGHGITKHVYLGIYRDQASYNDDQTQRVAVKMVTRNVVDVVSCIRRQHAVNAPISTPSDWKGHRFNGADRDRKSTVEEDDARRRRCYIPPNMKLMKEILLHDQLRHPGLVPLLGYCARSEETESTSIADHGVVGVYAYAEHFYASSMSSWSFERRLEVTHRLADLLDYLEKSPLGSLRIADFKESHFLLLPDINDTSGKRIVMTDLDDLTSAEPSCVDAAPMTQTSKVDSQHDLKQCDYEVKCVGGECSGYNAKYNMDRMTRLYFNLLLYPADIACTSADGHVVDDVTPRCECTSRVTQAMSDLRRQLNYFQLNANQLLHQIDAIRRELLNNCVW